MRVLVVLCLAFAFAAAQEEDATTITPESTIGCIRRVVETTFSSSRDNTIDFIRKLSPKGNVEEVIANVTAEYEVLQQKVEESTQEIIQDRAACEKRNEKAIFKRRCGTLARISFIRKNTWNVMILTKNIIGIISRAHLDFAKDNVLSNLIAFIRQQSGVMMGSVRDGLSCIRSR